SDCRTSINDPVPPFSRTSTRCSDSRREPKVRLEISISRSNSSNWKYDEATLLTRLDITARCPHSVARRLARASSVPLRNLPQKSNSQNKDRLTAVGLNSIGCVTFVCGSRWLLVEAPPEMVGN